MDRLHAMEVFVRVVETGSFSKTAAEFGITQPTVTKQVAAIESRLKVRLLNRNTRGISLTEVGALYYDKCRSIVKATEDADGIARIQQSEAQGLLRIGCSVGFGRRVIVPLVLDFMSQHPNLQVDLSFEDRYVDLVAQGIDVAVRLGKLADSALGARFLGTNPWVMVASRTYLERHGSPKRASELSDHATLIYSSVQGGDVWRVLSAYGEPETVPVTGGLRSNNLSSVLAAAKAGMGIAALPCYVASGSLSDDSVVRVLEENTLPEQEIHAVFPSPKLVSAKVLTFIAYLQGRFDERWWDKPTDRF